MERDGSLSSLLILSRMPFTLPRKKSAKDYSEHFQLEIERRGNKRDGNREEREIKGKLKFFSCTFSKKATTRLLSVNSIKGSSRNLELRGKLSSSKFLL